MTRYIVEIQPEYYVEEVIVNTKEPVRVDVENDVLIVGETRIEFPIIKDVKQCIEKSII